MRAMNIPWITIAAVILIISGVLIYKETGGSLQAISVVDAADQSIVTEMFGYLKCEATGQFTNWVAGSGYSYQTNAISFGYTCNDPQKCEIRFSAVCKDGNQDNLFYGSSVGFGTGTSAKSKIIPLVKDQTFSTSLWCVETNYAFGVPVSSYLAQPIAGGYELRKTEYGIYMYTEGYGKQGLIESSLPGCGYVSTNTDIKSLIKVQRTGTTFIDGYSLALGRTVPITVGWTQMPAIGNINPAGTFNGNDVVCRASTSGAEIIRLEKIVTNAPKTYYINKGVIASGSSYCCPGSVPCSTGYQCENYQCKQTTTCVNGQCNAWQAGTYLEKDTCSQISGSYYTYDKYCDANACIQFEAKTPAKCCPGTCGLGKICDINAGCIAAEVLKPCPTAECCIEGGAFYKQDCVTGQCCYDLGDPYHGSCKAQCTLPPDEITAKQNCEAQGGKYIQKSVKDCFLFFCSESDTSFCRMPHNYWVLLAVVFVGLATAIAGVIYHTTPAIVLGAIVAIISLIAYALGLGGII